MVGLFDSGLFSAPSVLGPGRFILPAHCKSVEQVEYYEEAIVISTLAGIFQKWNSPLNRGILRFRERQSPISNPRQVDEFVNPVLGLPSR